MQLYLISIPITLYFLLRILLTTPALPPHRPPLPSFLLLLPLLLTPLSLLPPYLLCTLVSLRFAPQAPALHSAHRPFPRLTRSLFYRVDVTLYLLLHPFLTRLYSLPLTIISALIAVLAVVAHVADARARLNAARIATSRLTRSSIVAALLPSAHWQAVHDDDIQDIPPTPSTASVFTMLSFDWMTATVSKGRVTPLEAEDVVPLQEKFRCARSGEGTFQPLWNEEQTRQTPRLFRALFRGFGRRLVLGGLLKICNDVTVFVSPMLLRLIITHLQQRVGDPNPMRGLWLALGLFATYTCQYLFFNQYFNIITTVQVQVRNALISAVYSKATKLTPESRGLYTSGQIQNLMATDARTVSDVTLYIHMLWSSVEQIIVAMVLLVNLMGWIPTLAGIAFLLTTMPLQARLMTAIKAFRETASSRTDERVKAVSEAIKGIKLVKLYAWELSFVRRILGARAQELEYLRKMSVAQACTSTLSSSLPTMLTVFAFFAYAMTGRVLNAAIVFPAIALFNVIRPQLLFLPYTVINAARAAASLSRLQKFLSAEELAPIATGTHAVDQAYLHLENIDAAADNAAFAWDPSISLSSPTLHSVSFQIPKGALVAVVGPTGAGKSTLLAGMLGEVPIVEGKVGLRENRSVSYCDQVPFIQNATVRDNILFGKPYHDAHYRKTVRVCSLIPDLKILPAGDMTEIGGRGVNLSGGQRARVSLARAVYAKADICLLDDPLSAVDAHVGKFIFERCIVGELKGTTRIVTTNQVHFAASAHVDYVVFVKNGAVAEFGRRSELLADSSSEFARLVEASGALGVADESEGSSGDIEEEESFEEGLILGNGVVDKAEQQPGEKDVSEKVKTKSTSALLDKDDGIVNYGAIEAGKLTRKETKDKGRVKVKHYLTYLRAMGLYQWVLPICLFAVLSQLTSLSVNVWLSVWSEQSSNMKEGDPDRTIFNLIVFCAMGLFAVLVTAGSSFSLAFGSIRASVLLHEKLLLSVFGAPTSFFNSTPEGRLVNRFNSDMDKVDSMLGSSMQALMRLVLNLSITMGLILWATPAFILFVIPVAGMCLYIQEFYRKSSVDLRRLEAMSRSPLYAHFGETLDGVMTIRAYGAVERMLQVNEQYTDELSKMTYSASSANRWIQVRLESMGTVLIFSATCLAVFSPPEKLSASMSGLVLSYVMQILPSMTWTVRQFTEAESQLSAMERVSEYSEPPFLQEERGGLEGFLREKYDSSDSLNRDDSKGLISERTMEQLSHGMQQRKSRWPRKGKIVFDQVEMRYRDDLPPALKSLSLTIAPGEHVGIVGRTGAGKSSAIQCLFRLYELNKGRIEVDGVDISKLRLFDLRSSLGIIPQEPHCFSGTIRTNLDMFGEHDDTSVRKALAACGLQDTMKEKVDLDFEVAESGSNLSVGQRQLLCLGRALLRDSQVLVLDEATSNVSNETDEKIQKTLRSEMEHCTILTVAHRLHTVMQSDRIIVMDSGRVAEMGTPSELLSKPSMLSDLVDETGPSTAAHLRHLASIPRNAANGCSSLSNFVPAAKVMRSARANQADALCLLDDGNESMRTRVKKAFTELRSALLDIHSVSWQDELSAANVDPEQWQTQLHMMISKLSALANSAEEVKLPNGSVEAFGDNPNQSMDMIDKVVEESSPMRGMRPREKRNSHEDLSTGSLPNGTSK